MLDHGLLTDARLNDAIAISQASPGPLGMCVVLVSAVLGNLGGTRRRARADDTGLLAFRLPD